ncbi:flippase [Patescibacteria group bacterium]|nr:flippase [Patescibacteria group bacterium]
MFSSIRGFLFENRTQKQTVAKNTFWLFLGQASGRILRVILVIFAARILGPESWGAFSYVMSLVAFLLIFSDVGISAIVTRESAKDLSRSAEYFSTAFFLKIVLLAAGSCLLIFGAPYLTKIPEARGLLTVVTFLLIFDSLRNFGFAISRAIERMQWEAADEIVTNLMITGLGIAALLHSGGTEALAYAYIIGTAVGMILMFILLRNYIARLFTHFQKELIRPILTSSLPFAFASFLGAIMINTDLIMLGWMRSPAEIGFYSAAQRPVQFLYTLAGLFAASLFPILSKLAHDERNVRFRYILERTLTASLFAAIPAVVIGLPLSTGIIRLLFGAQYLPATASFQVLLLTVAIIFPSVIISNSLLAYDQQKQFVTFSLVGAVGNILFNFLLIPAFGIVGCSISTLATQIIANAFIWHRMNEVVPFTVMPRLVKIVTASVLAALVAVLLQIIQPSVLIDLAAATAMYLGMLALWKEEAFTYILTLL